MENTVSLLLVHNTMLLHYACTIARPSSLAFLPVRSQTLAKLVKGAARPLLLHVDDIHRRLLADPLRLFDALDLLDDLRPQTIPLQLAPPPCTPPASLFPVDGRCGRLSPKTDGLFVQKTFYRLERPARRIQYYSGCGSGASSFHAGPRLVMWRLLLLG